MAKVKEELIGFEESLQDYLIMMEEIKCGENINTVHTSTDTNSKNGRSKNGLQLRKVSLKRKPRNS